MKNYNFYTTFLLLGGVVFMNVLIGQEMPVPRNANPIAGGEEATNDAFFSFIPTSDLPSTTSQTTCEYKYQPSGSTWGPDADESHVFFATITNNESKKTAWRLGIGKGGQIYSFRGPFGESIPPQANAKSKWVDEVWQNVAVAGNKINNDSLNEEGLPTKGKEDHIRSMKFFIHQAGTYRHDEALSKVFYAPPLANYWDAKAKLYSHLSWGQQPSTPSIHKSGLLNYTRYRDLGDGVIEVTHVMYNFGEDTLDHINMPWGGFRTSSLPQQWLSKSDGSQIQLPLDHTYDLGIQDLKETYGYFMCSQDDNETHYAQSIVFGQDRHFSEFKKLGLARSNSRIRYGLSSKPGKPWTTARDYTVFFVGAYNKIKQGDLFYWRNYFVVGPMKRVAELSKKLKEKADYGYIDLTAKDAATITYYVDKSEPMKLIKKAPGAPAKLLTLSAWPNRGSLPVILMKDTTSGQYFMSTDPYVNAKTFPFSNPYEAVNKKFETYQNRTTYQHYLTTEYVKILGFIMPIKENLAKVREIIGDSKFCRM